jgi:hypothetical protein
MKNLHFLSRFILFFGVFMVGGVASYSVFAQASVVASSIANTKTSYTAGAGNNRLIVVAVSGKRAAGTGTITTITWNGQALTQVLGQSGPAVTPTLRTEIWYLNEAGIRAAGYCTTASFVVTWSTAPTTEAFSVLTLQDVDQTTPIPAGTSSTSNTNAGATANITLPAISTGAANDIIFYASASNSNKTHSAPVGYTEQSDQIVGATTALATATKQKTSGVSENPIADWNSPAGSSQLNIVGVMFNGNTATSTAVTTYYSFASGAWDANTSWSLSSDGSTGALPVGVWPRRADNVVIKSGHTITINATDDNKTCGMSADGLGRTNVGPFTGSSTAAFYQTGDILVNGTLTINPVFIMVENYTHVVTGGTVSAFATLINLGYLEADASTTWTGLDKLALAGTSTTLINTSSTLTDDIIISFTSATLCGTGTTTLQNGGGSIVDYQHGATVAQICTSFTVACSGAAGGGCGASATTFPVVGTTDVILGNVGLGGVGNSTNNKLWLRANDLSLANGAAVSAWNDVSGNGLSATNGTAAERPTFITPSVNGLPSISFDGTTDNLSLGAPAGLNFIPGTDSWSFFIAFNSPTNGANAATQTPNQGTLLSKAWTTTRNYQYQIDDITAGNSAFTSYIGGTLNSGTVVCNTGAWFISSHTNNTTTKSSWTNEGSNFAAAAIGTGADATTEVLIGARRDTGPANGTEGFWYTGNIAEIGMYNKVVNLAQRIIISNYLAAKYAVTLSANDLYTMDNAGNGHFDFEMAGIGQASDGSYQRDGRGSDIVRMWNPSTLANSRFLMWGHDNSILYSSTKVVGTTVDGTIIKERLTRVWRVSESGGDVGTVSISFDISSFTTALGSNLRLLIDRDGDGFQDNDVTPITGTYASNTIVFSGINFQDGDRFTLGNTDLTHLLPIELVSFTATPVKNTVNLKWTTASEKNNDYFTIERSKDGLVWENGQHVRGSGTTKTKTTYETVDDGPYKGVSYYRLKQTDFDGQFTRSAVVRVYIENTAEIVIYPNPFSGSFKFSADSEVDGSRVKLYSSSGVEIPISIAKEGTEFTISPGNISEGLYILQVADGFKIKTIKVIKSNSTK